MCAAAMMVVAAGYTPGVAAPYPDMPGIAPIGTRIEHHLPVPMEQSLRID